MWHSFPQEQKQEAIHIVWKRKRNDYIVRESFAARHLNAQGQKYALVPAWRIERRGRHGEKK